MNHRVGRLRADYVASDLRLGYAQTSHATQGRTVDTALLLIDSPTDHPGVYTPMTDQLQIEKLGTTFSRINVAQILELRVPAPAPNEQRELSAAFDLERQRVDHLVAKLTHRVDLLAERRQALVTAAVVGELDVARSIDDVASRLGPSIS